LKGQREAYGCRGLKCRQNQDKFRKRERIFEVLEKASKGKMKHRLLSDEKTFKKQNFIQSKTYFPAENFSACKL
jgi:hypothetical protein